ncbi:MAG: hypothetical protein ACP5PJ_05895 [Acidimicrobiales bacterium]
MIDAYAALLMEVANAAGSELLIGGVKPDRRAVTGLVLRNVEGGRDLPTLEASRLRSTWLVSHLRARTRLDHLIKAAGLVSLTSLEDLLVYLPDQDISTVMGQLRAESVDPKLPRVPFGTSS